MEITGAVPQFLAERFGGMVRPVARIVSVQLAQTNILPGNMDRVAVIFVNFGTNTIVISPMGGVTASNGIPVSAGGGIIGFNVRDDAILPAWEWLGITTVGATDLFALEIIREVRKK